jgi:hypothetical protein
LNALYYFYSPSIWKKLQTVTGKYLLLSWGDKNWEAYHKKPAGDVLNEAGRHFQLALLRRENERTVVLYERT